MSVADQSYAPNFVSQQDHGQAYQSQDTLGGMEFDDDVLDTHFSDNMVSQNQSVQRRWTRGQFADDASSSNSDQNVEEDEKSDDSGFEILDGYGLGGKKEDEAKETKKMNFPKPIYPDIIEIGIHNTKSILDQVLEQLNNIKREEYVWWNGDQRIGVDIPNDLYSPTFQQLERESSSMSQPGSAKERRSSFRKRGTQRATASALPAYESVLTTPDPKILVTQDTFYIFSLETEYDRQKAKQGNKQEGRSDDVIQERLDKMNSTQLVKVRDVQIYHFIEFEFLQKQPQPSRSFVLSKYNMTGSQNDSSQQLTIRCYDDDTLFMLIHLIEKFLPAGWQSLLEKQLPIRPPDSYQFHCYLVQKGGLVSQGQQRTYAITQLFIYSTVSVFHKKICQVEIKETKWQLPIQAITDLSIIEEKGKKLKLTMIIDHRLQNEILQKYRLKKSTQAERIVEFPLYKRTTARDFVWHVKRIHHWWQQCAIAEGRRAGPALNISVIR